MGATDNLSEDVFWKRFTKLQEISSGEQKGKHKLMIEFTKKCGAKYSRRNCSAIRENKMRPLPMVRIR